MSLTDRIGTSAAASTILPQVPSTSGPERPTVGRRRPVHLTARTKHPAAGLALLPRRVRPSEPVLEPKLRPCLWPQGLETAIAQNFCLFGY